MQVWRDRYERLGAGLVVGISWQGGKNPAVRRQRSTALPQWAPLFRIPGVAFVNLQYGDCRAEIESCRRELGITIHDWEDCDPLFDLDGFAAKIASLDLVISVDNSTVHLAGTFTSPRGHFSRLPVTGDGSHPAMTARGIPQCDCFDRTPLRNRPCRRTSGGMVSSSGYRSRWLAWRRDGTG